MSQLDQILTEVRALLPEGWVDQDWYCPTCKAHLSGGQVTNDERHWKCGTFLGWPQLDLSKCPTLRDALVGALPKGESEDAQ